MLPAAQAWVLPPSILQPIEGPIIYVWGGILTEERVTIPRGRAQKRVTHTISLYVQYMSEPDPALVQQFPVLLDAIRAVLRSIQLPVPLTDPTTGETSTLQDIGERIQQTYSTPVAMSLQGVIQHNAGLRLTANEWLNPA